MRNVWVIPFIGMLVLAMLNIVGNSWHSQERRELQQQIATEQTQLENVQNELRLRNQVLSGTVTKTAVDWALTQFDEMRPQYDNNPCCLAYPGTYLTYLRYAASAIPMGFTTRSEIEERLQWVERSISKSLERQQIQRQVDDIRTGMP